jgi:hypothetical protein
MASSAGLGGASALGAGIGGKTSSGNGFPKSTRKKHTKAR